MSDATSELAERLHSRGLRHTEQRERILLAVRTLGHATPEQITTAVDGVDVTTVYRALELLEEIGLVRHTHLGHGAPSYRPAEDDHIHVVCHSCGSVIEVDQHLVDPLQATLSEVNDFELDRSHFTVFGRCSACRAADSSGAERPGATGTKHTHPTMNHRDDDH